MGVALGGVGVLGVVVGCEVGGVPLGACVGDGWFGIALTPPPPPPPPQPTSKAMAAPNATEYLSVFRIMTHKWWSPERVVRKGSIGHQFWVFGRISGPTGPRQKIGRLL